MDLSDSSNRSFDLSNAFKITNFAVGVLSVC